MTTYRHILYETERGRARITLDRPDKRNALSVDLLEELNHALWEADDDRDVHCVILRGAGRSFCAGYDLSPGRNAEAGATGRSETKRYRRGTFSTFEDDTWTLERNQRLLMVLFDMHKPTIAQVHGHCLAGGTDVAFYCDMVIAAEDARFGFPPARDLGALPNQMWLYHLGPQWTKRLMLTGDTISGLEAADLRLVLKAVPEAELGDEVEALADRLALIDVELLAANKRIVNLGLELMGARTLQRLACENDARGHQTPSADGFRRTAAEKGLKAALAERDGKFGDGRARVRGRERRDAAGRLID